MGKKRRDSQRGNNAKRGIKVENISQRSNQKKSEKPEDIPINTMRKNEINKLELSELKQALNTLETDQKSNTRSKEIKRSLILKRIEALDNREVTNFVNDDNADFIDPAEQSLSVEETKRLAQIQTLAARNLLYHPNNTLKTELSEAAKALKQKLDGFENDLVKALGGRIFGEQGSLPGQGPKELLATLQRIIDQDGTGKDHSIFIALAGDVGALYADTGATTGVENRTPEQAQELRDKLFPELKNLVGAVDKRAGSGAVGPNKKKERKRPSGDLPKRSGIHNTNAADVIDTQLGIDDNAKILPARWQVATITKDRLAQTAEPLVGHMSGSPSEILLTWDTLRGVSEEERFLGQINYLENDHLSAEEKDAIQGILFPALYDDEIEARLARAAGASAFLVGGGYHSAVEVAESILLYSGQDLRTYAIESPTGDAANVLGNDAATFLIKELHEGQTDPEKIKQL